MCDVELPLAEIFGLLDIVRIILCLWCCMAELTVLSVLVLEDCLMVDFFESDLFDGRHLRLCLIYLFHLTYFDEVSHSINLLNF